MSARTTWVASSREDSVAVKECSPSPRDQLAPEADHVPSARSTTYDMSVHVRHPAAGRAVR